MARSRKTPVQNVPRIVLATPTRLSAGIRVSRIMGRDGEGFISPDEQKKAIDRWAKTRDITIVSYHEELDVSGGTTDRSGLDAALEEVYQGKSDGIVVAQVDRFARSLPEGLKVINDLEERGKAFVVVNNGIEPGMTQTSTGWLLLSVLLMMAEWQLRSIKESWITAKRRAVDAGIANAAPFGYVRNEHRRLEPSDTAPWVQYMFAERVAGTSWTDIARHLNENQVPTPRGGGQWLHSGVQQIVRSRAYLGELRIGQDVNKSAWEPLVAADLWERANAQTVTSRSADRVTYMLTGLPRCATCGGRMAGFRSKDNRYYRCRQNYKWGRCPNPALVPADDLETVVVGRFMKAYYNDMNAVQVGDGTVAGRELTAALAEQQSAEADMTAYLSAPGLASIPPAMFEAALSEHKERLNAAGQAVSAARVKVTGVDLPSGLPEAWGDLSTEQQRRILASGIAVVAVKANGTRRPVPIDGRVRVWLKDEPGTPEGLPDRRRLADDGTPVVKSIRPIEF